ncbi:hypothetical protein D908_20718 [Vibrio mimicus CAIM 602]|nr:hypothetical protein D908_20718 [Vibrio mimicus CAIM 602]
MISTRFAVLSLPRVMLSNGATQMFGKLVIKFLLIGGWSSEEKAAFTFKVSDLNFDFLSNCSGYKPAPYFANRGMKWIQQIDDEGHLDEELRYYLSESYKIVASGLSKKKQVELGILCQSVIRT